MYRYEEQKKNIFTEDGQIMFLKIRDNVHRLLEMSGAFLISRTWEDVSGSSWDMFACVDRLVELGEIVEIKRKNAEQSRIFVSSK